MLIRVVDQGIGDFRYWIFMIAAIKCGYVVSRESDAR